MRYKAAQTFERVIGLLYHLLRGMIQEVHIKTVLILLTLPHWEVNGRWVNPSVNLAEGIVFFVGFSCWQGR
jgi:hypothetical protein